MTLMRRSRRMRLESGVGEAGGAAGRLGGRPPWAACDWATSAWLVGTSASSTVVLFEALLLLVLLLVALRRGSLGEPGRGVVEATTMPSLSMSFRRHAGYDYWF
jgi:hypothetical protein